MILQIVCVRKAFCLLIALMFLGLLSGSSVSYGQNIQSIMDTVRLSPEIFLQRDYQFIISRNDTVLNGRYNLFLRPDLSDGFYARDYKFGELEANFEQNQRQGIFVLRMALVQPDIYRLYPASGYIRIPYSGTMSENRGQFEDDLPAGQWSFLQMEQAAGSAPDTVWQVQAFYGRGGALRDQYRIIDRQAAQVLVGSINPEGVLDDALDVRSRRNGKLLYRIVFEDGMLKAIDKPGEPTMRPDYQDKLREVKFEERPLDSLYTKVISYYLDMPQDKREELLRPLQKVFNAFRYLNGDQSTLMQHLPGPASTQYPRVRVPVYETTEEEVAIVSRKYNRLQELNRQMDSLMHTSALTLNRYSDQELAFLYAQMQLLKGRVGRQQQFSEILAGPLLPHIGPDWFIERRLQEVVWQDTVVYTFTEQEYREPVDFSFDTTGLSSFEQYQAYITTLEEKYLDLSRQLEHYLQRVERNFRLSENEERLSELSADIDRLADSVTLNMYNDDVSRNYKQAFVEFKEALLKEYADMEQQERVASLEQRVNCLEQLKSRLENAPLLAENERLVDEAYMDKRLNPYTFTEVDVRLFERLFRTYRDNLVPYLVNSMQQAEGCESFLERTDNLSRLQDFMLKALNDNPRRLERRIRNQDDPESIIRKLGVPVVL